MLSNGKPVGFEANGHAEYADEGSDIVCSAISALTQTTLMGLTEVVKAPVGFSIEDGDIYCVLGEDSTPAQTEQAELLFKVMRVGLTSIAQAYEGHLIITEREV